MADERKGGWVPLPRFFSLVGYVVFSAIVAATVIELAASVALSGYRILAYRYRFDAPHREVMGHCRGAGGDGRCPATDPGLNMMSASPVYQQAEWAEEFWRDERRRHEKNSFVYEPFRVWGMAEWHTRYVNSDGTRLGFFRRTIQASGSCAGREKMRAWLFGGSTAWGTGAPDFATIPSFLSRKAAGKGACLEVINFGAVGYVSNQEVILLGQALKSEERPDIVIFYDGINDAFYGAEAPEMIDTHPVMDQVKAKLESDSLINLSAIRARSAAFYAARRLLKGYRGSKPRVLDQAETRRRVDAIIANYESNLKLVRALAAEYGFRARWQPVLLFGDKPLVPFEHGILNALGPHEFGSARGSRQIANLIQIIYRQAEERATAAQFVFLGRIFDHVAEPLYVDEWHLGPRGNELVAEAILDAIL